MSDESFKHGLRIGLRLGRHLPGVAWGQVIPLPEGGVQAFGELVGDPRVKWEATLKGKWRIAFSIKAGRLPAVEFASTEADEIEDAVEAVKKRIGWLAGDAAYLAERFASMEKAWSGADPDICA